MTAPDVYGCPAQSPSTLPAQSPSTLEALRKLRLFALAPEKQQIVAAALESAGITAADICTIGEYVTENEPDAGKARRILGAVLSDPARAKLSIAGLAGYHREVAPVASLGTHQQNMPVPSWLCYCAQCDGARARGIANRGPRPRYYLDGIVPPPTELPDWAVVARRRSAEEEAMEFDIAEFRRKVREGSLR